jgi:hypothetical protein
LFSGDIKLSYNANAILHYDGSTLYARQETYYNPTGVLQGFRIIVYSPAHPGDATNADWFILNYSGGVGTRGDGVMSWSGDVEISGNLNATTITGSYSVNANVLLGTTLASNVVTSSLTSVGVLTSLSVSGAVTFAAGAIADAALTSNIPKKNAANTFSAAITFSSTVSFVAGSIADAALTSNVPLKNTANTFSAAQTITTITLNHATAVDFLTIVGSPTSILQIALGSSSVASRIGTQYSSGYVFMSYNANQPTQSTDSWAQSLTSNASGLFEVREDGFRYYNRASGASAANKATFWGASSFQFGPAIGLTIVDSSQSPIRLTYPGGATDKKKWWIQNLSDGTFRIRAVNDAETSGDNALQFLRSGATITAVYFGGYLGAASYAGPGVLAGDIIARRSSTTGVYYFGDSTSCYLYFDGGEYVFGGSSYKVNSPAGFYHSGVFDSTLSQLLGAWTVTGGITTPSMVLNGSVSYLALTGSGTNSTYLQFTNTGGTFYLGVDNSASTSLGFGAYNFGLYTPAGVAFYVDHTNKYITTLAGMAVGGALTQQGYDVAKVTWTTGAIATSDAAPASGAGTIKLKVT